MNGYVTIVARLTLLLGLVSITGGSGGADGGNAPTSGAPSNQAELSSLVLSSGTLNPTFAPAAVSYNTMFIGETSITVTPTAMDSRATITVNGTLVPSGQASAAIVLPAETTTIVAQVRAADGATTKTYTVTARRLSQEASREGIKHSDK